MKINKAVITAAAPNQPSLPFQSLVDRNGQDKTSLQLIVDEVVEAGIDNICIVIRPGERESFTLATQAYDCDIAFIEQDDPQGYADSLLRARAFVGDDHFLHLVGDHIYLSKSDRGCARQLVEFATQESCATTMVQSTRENQLPYFGAIGANRLGVRIFEINQVVEKPTPTLAEQELIVAGLRAGYYLCVAGMHVLPPTFMDILQADFADNGTRHITDALNNLAQKEKYLAFQIDGRRFNIGVTYGLLRAQLEIALAGQDRDMILSDLVTMLAEQDSSDNVVG